MYEVASRQEVYLYRVSVSQNVATGILHCIVHIKEEYASRISPRITLACEKSNDNGLADECDNGTAEAKDYLKRSASHYSTLLW